jgi:Putative zinc-finger
MTGYPPDHGPYLAGNPGLPSRGPQEHDPGELGALALGLLDPERARVVEQHLATCASCRRDLEDLTAVTQMLGEVPPEALLEGPPDGDLVLQRTLRQIRAEAAADRRRRMVARVASAAAVVALLLAGGVTLGRATSPAPVVIATAAPHDAATTLRGTGPAGVAMAAAITPAAGWVRVAVNVRGIPPGERCSVLVLGRDGSRAVAASWLTTPKGQSDGIEIDGAAIVAPDQVAGVAVEDDSGNQYVTLKT